MNKCCEKPSYKEAQNGLSIFCQNCGNVKDLPQAKGAPGRVDELAELKKKAAEELKKHQEESPWDTAPEPYKKPWGPYRHPYENPPYWLRQRDKRYNSGLPTTRRASILYAT